MKKIILIFLGIGVVFINEEILCQNTYRGVVTDSNENKRIEYVNIGLVGKDLGTVSDSNGEYSLAIDSIYENTYIKFSHISYNDTIISFNDFTQNPVNNIALHPKTIELQEVSISPVNYLLKKFGNSYKSEKLKGGFKNNQKGSECGVLLGLLDKRVLGCL